jgi:hypothetical protein
MATENTASIVRETLDNTVHPVSNPEVQENSSNNGMSEE